MIPGAAGNGRLSRNGIVAVLCAALVAGMVGLSFASVPLYRLFCQVTGYDGTTRRASVAPDIVVERSLTIGFDANVGPGISLALRAGAAPAAAQDRRAGARLLPGHQPLEHAAGRHGGVQRDAAQGRQPTSTRSSASASRRSRSSRARAPSCRWSTSSIRRSMTIPISRS